jgi:lysozyme family protein
MLARHQGIIQVTCVSWGVRSWVCLLCTYAGKQWKPHMTAHTQRECQLLIPVGFRDQLMYSNHESLNYVDGWLWYLKCMNFLFFLHNAHAISNRTGIVVCHVHPNNRPVSKKRQGSSISVSQMHCTEGMVEGIHCTTLWSLEERLYRLTPKDPWVFGCKITQNYPFLKKGLIIIFWQVFF